MGGTSRIQCPNVPKITEEGRMSVWFVRSTFKIAMSLMTGALMVVTRRRMAATSRKRVPNQWSGLIIVNEGERSTQQSGSRGILGYKLVQEKVNAQRRGFEGRFRFLACFCTSEALRVAS